MKVLFIEPYPIEGPSSRYRVEQYIPYLEKNGIKCVVRPFVSSKFYKIIYKKGLYFRKILFFFQSSFKRFFDIFTAFKSDLIFIHLEAYPIGPPVFECLLSILGKKIIYDLDDAIYLGTANSVNRVVKYLKWPSKVSTVIKYSSHIITCNEYLAKYARKFNENVTAIHTSVNADIFIPKKKKNKGKRLTIGWIGSHSTTPYFEELMDVFTSLGKIYSFDLKIVGAAYDFSIPGVNVVNLPWRLSDEVEQFQSLDIGIYPLPDNEWISGKTGFKTIQYMSVGIPSVVSNVGANIDLIQNGINGFLAGSKEEWIERLSELIEDAELRYRIGAAARRTLEEKFSLKLSAPKYLKIIIDTLAL